MHVRLRLFHAAGARTGHDLQRVTLVTAADEQGPILIATDSPSDASMIRKLLSAE